MNGPTATVTEMSVEDFRRVWSGIALLPVAHGPRRAVLCLVLFAAGLALPQACRLDLGPNRPLIKGNHEYRSLS